MKELVSFVLSFVLWFLFAMGITGTLTAGHFLYDSTQQLMANIAMIVISLVAGSLLARREPVKSWLASRPVLWFLFLFNLGAGVVAFFVLGGPQGLMALIGLGVVALGAGSGLVLRRRKPAELTRH